MSAQRNNDLKTIAALEEQVAKSLIQSPEVCAEILEVLGAQHRAIMLHMGEEMVTQQKAWNERVHGGADNPKYLFYEKLRVH